MHNVLIIEDSPEIFRIVERFLGQDVHLTWAKTVNEAETFLRQRTFDLIILDVILPDGDGFDFFSKAQAEGVLADVPVVFLTSKGAIQEKVLGFSLGAEDYIVKPFDPMELKARVEAKLKKRDRSKLQADTLRWNGLEINKSSQRVWINESGKPEEIHLTSIEFKLLILLASHPHRVFSRDDILDAVWGQSLYVYPRSVDTHISKLRKKLGPGAKFIESVHGSGYRFRANKESAPGALTADA